MDRRRCLLRTLISGTALLAAPLVALPVQASHGPIGGHAIVDCGGPQHVLDRNDDGFSQAVPIGFPIRFFGETYTSLFVNNNGNVTFTEGRSAYVPDDLYQIDIPIIAPFFTDIDTRNPETSPVAYGPFSYDGRTAFCVNWINVGEYSYGSVPNDIQLLLVERSAGTDVSSGDFDIVFNYDRIQWDHGGARAGYSNGSRGLEPGSALELNGSGIPGAFLDSNAETGLVHNYAGQSPDTAQLGRYVFPVRNGEAPPPGGISGRVFDARGGGTGESAPGVAGAVVTACRSTGGCRTGGTNELGSYTLLGLPPGDYVISVSPPTGFFPVGGLGPVTVASNPVAVPFSVGLTGPQPMPAGSTIDGAIGGTGPGQVPVVVVGQEIVLRTTGCVGGAGLAYVTQNGAPRQLLQGGVDVASATMTQEPAGTYAATVQLPFTGAAEIRYEIAGCPTISFNIYIDPSGFIRTVAGAPIVGATVTLYRSETGEPGTFAVVTNGSELMSPSNRTNPDATDATGHFGWDVVAGFYFVRASAPGCVSPLDQAQAFRDTVVYTIPPPVTDIDLRLQCGPLNSPPELAPLSIPAVDATSPLGAVVTFTASATDPDGETPAVACVPASGTTFAIGSTVTTCTATDGAGETDTLTATVVVRGASTQLASLRALVVGYALQPTGQQDALTSKIDAASQAIAASRRGDACGALKALRNHTSAQRDKKISVARATEVLQHTDRIRAVLAC